MASMQDATFFCIPSSKLPYQERVIYCGLCLASAGLGFLGAMWQIYQWKPLTSGYKHRRKPSPNPMIVFSLALADLLACSGEIHCFSCFQLVNDKLPLPLLRWDPIATNEWFTLPGCDFRSCHLQQSYRLCPKHSTGLKLYSDIAMKL